MCANFQEFIGSDLAEQFVQLCKFVVNVLHNVLNFEDFARVVPRQKLVKILLIGNRLFISLGAVDLRGLRIDGWLEDLFLHRVRRNFKFLHVLEQRRVVLTLRLGLLFFFLLAQF